MKQNGRIGLVWMCAFLILALSVGTAIAEDAQLIDFQSALGVQADMDLSGQSFSDIRKGDIIRAKVVDPSKIGGCNAGDSVELFYMGESKWMVKHLDSGNAVDIVTIEEDGRLKVAKTGTYQRVETEAAETPPPPAPQYVEDRGMTLVFKGGAYTPTDDLDDFDTGFQAEIAMNRYFSPNFALEATVGYFQTSGDLNGSINNYPLLADTDIFVIPVTANCKGILPFSHGEAYLGAGLGFYYVDGDMDISVAGGRYSASDNDYIFGAQFLAGVSFNIGQRMFIGMEAKQIFTDEANLIDKVSSVPAYVEAEFNLSGFMVSGLFGYRF